MRLKYAILAPCALAVVVVAGTGVSAAAAPLGALWNLNEVESGTAYDSSGNGNNGANYNVVGTGSGYVFNGYTSRVIVPDDASLDPGTADFSYSVTFTTSVPAANTDYDLLRKGIASTTGGEYKVEILNVHGQARAFCLVKDAAKVVASIRGTTNLAGSAPHTITCSKTSTGVTMRVDALAPRTRTVTAGLGSVSNSDSLVLGAKAQTGGDWFDGTMLDAQVTG